MKSYFLNPVALIIMVAKSRPEEKELLISVILNCLLNDFDA